MKQTDDYKLWQVYDGREKGTHKTEEIGTGKTCLKKMTAET